jgi:ABC-type multidrug transport system fused ATPase/permease subunit
VEVASYASVREALRKYREVVVTGRRGLYVERFKVLRWRAARVVADLQLMSQVSKYVFDVALIVGAALLAISQFLTRDAVGATTVFVVFLAAATRMMSALLRLQAAARNIKSQGGVAQLTFELARELDWRSALVAEVVSSDAQLRERVVQGIHEGYSDFIPKVLIRSVTMTYPSAQVPAARDVSFALPAGSSLALVGSTGVGKSTLTDLIFGVINPDSGEVDIGGELPYAAVRRWPGAIADVPQDIAIVSGTVRDNVALGLPEEAISDEKVWEALKRVHLAQFLDQSREGVDTLVGENGMQLSGAQWQRLGLSCGYLYPPQTYGLG